MEITDCTRRSFRNVSIRPVWSVFTVRMKKAWVLSYPLSAQRKLWSDWADAQADLSLRRAHMLFVGFVMSWLIYCIPPTLLVRDEESY